MSEACDLFYSYSVHVLEHKDSSDWLAFPDFLAASGSSFSSVQNFIDSLFASDRDSRFLYSSFSYSPLSLSDPVNISLPFEQYAQLGFPYGDVLELRLSPSSSPPSVFYQGGAFDYYSMLFPELRLDFGTGFLIPSLTDYRFPAYVSFSKHSIKALHVNRYNLPSGDIDLDFDFDVYGFSPPPYFVEGDFNYIYLLLPASGCDCCGCCEDSVMADCQTLVDKLNEILVEFQSFNEKYDTITDQLTESTTALANIGVLLNLRLVHRDFSAQSMVDLSKSIGFGADTISQRLAALSLALTGVAPPASGVPDTPETSLSLNADTPPSGGESGGGG